MTTSVDFSQALAEESHNCNNEMSSTVNAYMVNKYEKVINVHEYLGFSQGIMGKHLMIFSLCLRHEMNFDSFLITFPNLIL